MTQLRRDEDDFAKQVIVLGMRALASALSERAMQGATLLIIFAAWGFTLAAPAAPLILGLRILGALLLTVAVLYLARLWTKKGIA